MAAWSSAQTSLKPAFDEFRVWGSGLLFITEYIILDASRRPPRPGLRTYVRNWLEVFVSGKHPEPASLPREKLPC